MTPILRGFSLAFLAWHAGRLLPGLADPWFLALAAVLGLTGGILTKGLRGALSAATAVGFGLAASVVLTLPWTDTFPLWADRQLPLAALPFALAWLEGWAFTDRPAQQGLERLIHAVAVVAVFWSQGPYQVTLYPAPLWLALVFGVFLGAEAILLAGKPPKVLSKAAALLVVVAVVGFLWSLLGRYQDQSTASGGGLMKPDLFQFDFAPLVRLESEITLGDHLVLLYREEGPPQFRYLRRMVLDTYRTDQGFSVEGGKPPSVGRRVQTFEVPGNLSHRTQIHQEYYLVNLDPSSFLGLNQPTRMTPFAQWNRSSFVNAYAVDSLVAGQEFWLMNDNNSDGLSPEERRQLTEGGQDPEIRALAESVTRGATTTYEKATAIVLYLKENYFYSLKPGAPGARGALKHFLFESKKGYCSYFAFSMALMLRSLEIPTRIAVGFITNPDEAVLGFAPVRAFQAHAWVEVPFEGLGWLEFDPTSDTPAPGEPFRFPPPTEKEVLTKLIAEILEAQPQPLDDSLQPATETERDPVGPGLGPWLPWFVLAVLVMANEAWRHRWRWRRGMARGPQARVALRWAELKEHARRAHRGPFPGETPEAWASRERDSFAQLAALAETASQVRYARRWDADLAEWTRGVGRLIRTFDRLRPTFHRVMGNLFPWWPR